jgi:DNA-binding MarR family transcriptional regulator
MGALAAFCRANPRETAEMTVRQLALLGLVAEHPGHSCLFYATELGVSKPVVTRACAQLSLLGLMTVRRAEDDRRQNVIVATDAGAALVAGAVA